MLFFAASPFLKALGWALLNSLWQFAICWLLYRTITDSIKKLSASARHSIALFLLACGTFSFIIGLSWKYYTNETAFSADGWVFNSQQYSSLWNSANAAIDAMVPWASLLYIACVCFLLIKFCLFVRRAGSLQNNGVSKMNGQWRMYVKDVAAQLGIKKEVRAMLSVYIDTPQVIGFFKPVILLPAACLANLTTAQLEAVLLHELVHIRRNDYLVNIFVASVDILFFFNPFVKQLTRSIRKEREYSCDDMVIQFQYHPHNYASALLMLEKNRMLPVTYGIAASGKNQQQLMQRIERIMGLENKKIGFYRLGACLLALLLLVFIATVNPARIAVDNLGEVNLALAFAESPAGTHLNDEANTPASNLAIKQSPAAKENAQVSKVLTELKMSATASVSKVLTEKIKAENQALLFTTALPEDEDREATLQNVANKTTIDFALPQKAAPKVPAAEETEESDAVPEPYVPGSSFSFQLMQDTAMPKQKGETYNEKMANDAMLKTQKALNQLNWASIEKQLKAGNKNLAKLKTEIERQLKSLNWQQINAEVKGQANLQQLQLVQDAYRQNQELKLYQLSEANREALSRQLAEQDQLLKDASLKAEESQKAIILQQKKLEAEMKKKRIIYL
ncbi:MAG: M56 family metallopeptidase [Chitinophagaceae bacterium]